MDSRTSRTVPSDRWSRSRAITLGDQKLKYGKNCLGDMCKSESRIVIVQGAQRLPTPGTNSKSGGPAPAPE